MFFYYYKLHLFESFFGLHWFSFTLLSAQCNTAFVVAPARVKYELLVLLRGFCWTFGICLKNCYVYIYISAVGQPQGPECWLQLLFLTVFMRFLACGWHRLICLGLGTNAQKHSVDGTCSQWFPPGRCFRAAIYSSVWEYVRSCCHSENWHWTRYFITVS